tara:strand:+ start:1172 stop:4657 length:3486 start_codon:yes stop_codon:yes gene_type:complete
MSRPSARAALGLAILFLLMSIQPIVSATTPRNAVDLKPSTFTTSYASSTDAAEYDTLSRTTSLARAPELWIIDGMLGIQHTLTAGVENLGSSSASNVAVEIVVLHDEYEGFELFNTTVFISQINSQSTQTVSATWIPTYSGNHTVRITTSHVSDTNPSNDVGFATITIGFLYERCESPSTWSKTSNWRIDSDNRLNGASSCRIGGSTSTTNYGNMWTETLSSPVLDFSDAHPNPNNGYGLGFFYTGNVMQGDTLQIRVGSGSNVANLFPNGGITGEVSGQPTSWLIQLSTVAGRSVPWLEIPPSVMGPQTRIEFVFTSDSTGTEVGYWVEDIVMFYDQKASPSEFELDLQGNPSGTSARGEWSDMGFTVRNNGNITDRFTLEAAGIPSEWDYRFTHPSGSGLLAGTEVTINPGESRNFRLQTKPHEQASTGSIQGTINVQSVQENTATDSLSFSAGVAPRYESTWTSISSSPKCSPGNVCSHSVLLENTGDGSDTFVISVQEVSVPDGWAFGVSSTQESSITLEPGQTQVIDFTMAVPSTALPGETAVVSIISDSQADANSQSIQQITIEASMISDLRIVESWDSIPTHVQPGESIELEWEIHNDASRLDEVEFNWTLDGAQTWAVSLSGPSSASIAPGASTVMRVSMLAPSDGHAGDPAPLITPTVTSTRSSITFSGESVTGPRIAQIHSLSMEIESDGFVAFLPEQPSPIEFSVQNHGNGVDRVKISIDGLPSGWTTTMLVDGEASDSTFEIDLAGYNGDVANITIVVVADASMSPGTEVWLTFTADSDIDSLDSTPSIIQIGYVDVIRSYYDENWQQQPENVRLGGIANSSYMITNTGNVVDSNLQTKVSISPVIPGLELTIFVDGAQYPTNQFIPLDLAPGSNSVIDAVVTIDESVALGTEVTITRFVTGGDANSPQQSQEDLVFSISEMRSLELGNPPLNLVEMGPSSRSEITLEVKGRSTQPEQVSVAIVIPDGIEVKCTPQNGEGVPTVTIQQSPDIDDVQQIECEIITGIDYNTGIIEFTLIASDGEQIGVFSTEIIRPQVEGGGFEIAGVDSMVIGGSAIIVILAVVSLIIALRLRNRMSEDEDEFDIEEDEIPDQVMAFSSTPMSVDPTTNVVEEVATQVQQWTDESGYTWRKMSDESIQWWNGTDWQDHS